MTVLHIINVRWYNATAWYATTVANAGVKFGDKHIISSTPNTPVLTVAESLGIENFALNYNSNNPFTIIKTIYKFSKKIKSIKPDFIIAHRGEFFIFLSLLKLFSRKSSWKLIRVRGDSRPPTSDKISRFTHNKIASAVIVPSKIIHNYFTEKLKSKPNHIHIIHGGVDREVFKKDDVARERLRKEFGYEDSDYVVAIIGRLDPVKGHDIFLKACGKLHKESAIKRMKILIVGKEENIKYDTMREMIAENGLDKITTLTGRREDIPAVINAIDLAVITSNASETIARVAFEILATEKDIIASNIGVLPEIVSVENIFKYDDYNELADKILHHKTERKRYYADDFYQEFRKVLSSI